MHCCTLGGREIQLTRFCLEARHESSDGQQLPQLHPAYIFPPPGSPRLHSGSENSLPSIRAPFSVHRHCARQKTSVFRHGAETSNFGVCEAHAAHDWVRVKGKLLALRSLDRANVVVAVESSLVPRPSRRGSRPSCRSRPRGPRRMMPSRRLRMLPWTMWIPKRTQILKKVSLFWLPTAWSHPSSRCQVPTKSRFEKARTEGREDKCSGNKNYRAGRE